MRGRKGFTLVELVVVITVISLLAAVAGSSIYMLANRAKRNIDFQLLTELNSRLAVGTMGYDELLSYALHDDGWEFAYSKERNDLVIVDDEGVVQAAFNDELVGKRLDASYKRVHEMAREDLEKPPTKPGIPSVPDLPDLPDAGHWWEAEGVYTPEALPEKGSEDYKALCAYEDLNLSNITSMPDSYFRLNSSDDIEMKVKRIYFGEAFSQLPNAAFRSNTCIEEVYFANAEVTIEDSAFRSCSALKSVNFDHIVSVGASSFYGCKELKEITFSNIKSMYDNSFASCVLDKMTFTTTCPIVSQYESGAWNINCKVTNLELCEFTIDDAHSTFNEWLSYLVAYIQTSNLYLENLTISNVSTTLSSPFIKLDTRTKVTIDQASYDSFKIATKTQDPFNGIDPTIV